MAEVSKKKKSEFTFPTAYTILALLLVDEVIKVFLRRRRSQVKA